MIVVALLESMGHIMNVLVVVMLFYLIFAIVGMKFYGGKFMFCSIDPYVLHTQQECEYAGGLWSVHDHNFDNVGTGMVTLLVVASLEGWPDIMFQAVDITDANQGPSKDN